MVAQATITKQAHAILSLYEKCFEEKYLRKPLMNRFREKWAAQDMILDLGYEDAQRVVHYYFRTAKQGHPLSFLFHKYDEIYSHMKEKEEDERKRAELRKETEERVKRWEEKNG